MANDLEVPIWFQADKLNVFQEVLKQSGTTVEQVLLKEMDALYERSVPTDRRAAIAAKLAEEEDLEAQAAARQAAESYRVSAIEIIRSDSLSLWKPTRAWDILSAAVLLRDALRQSNKSPCEHFEAALGDKEEITLREFNKLEWARLQDDTHTTGVFMVDFKYLQFGFVQPGEGWRYYSAKDISTAIFQANKKSNLSPKERLCRFTAALEGKPYMFRSPYGSKEVE